jgi:NAD(P)-dependent dehydrogenase (short-subunit alcohol dehydrogenase family)
VDNNLENQVAIVTGAGQGIGFGIARCLGRAGAQLVVADVNQERLDSATVALGEMGIDALAIACDVADQQSVNDLMAGASNAFGRIDVLVNNAGVIVVKPIDEQSESDWDRVIDINLKGTFLCAQAVLDPMAAGGGGSIINLCSMSAYGFTTPHLPYTASKAGIIGLTRDFAVEVADRQIRVNAIAPGPIETPMFDGLSQAQKDAHAAKVPLKRLGHPDDIGNTAVFLASGAAAFITGAVIPVTGGADLKYS